MMDRILGKIPTMYERDWTAPRRPILDKIRLDCAWVAAGEGRATRKWDGTPIAVIGGILFRRLDNKPGRIMPSAWRPAQPEPDPVTGEQPGWVPLDGANKEDRLVLMAAVSGLSDGTYEFCGPKVNGNPEGLVEHTLIPHGAYPLEVPDRTFGGLRAFLATANVEGIVFYHPDGRMAKIKGRDFGLKRNRPGGLLAE